MASVADVARLLMRAYVTPRGAIMLTESVAVDGHNPRSPVRVVTHIHSDHVLGLGESVRTAHFVLATRLTHELLEALGHRVPPAKRLSLPYGVSIDYDGVRIRLVRANHVPGTAQVAVEDEEGNLLAYTSDFKQPGTPVIQDPDVLVIDATYGYEGWVRPWQDEVERILVDIVLEALAYQRGVVIKAYQGKLQKVMHVLREEGVEAPFVAPRRVYQVAKVLAGYGLKTGDVLLEGSREAEEALRSGWYIYFTTNGYRRGPTRAARRPITIELTGWELDEPYKRLSETEWVVSYSDHADYRQTLEYVEESRPRLLVVDRYRGGRVAEYFAASVERKLGIRALALP